MAREFQEERFKVDAASALWSVYAGEVPVRFCGTVGERQSELGLSEIVADFLHSQEFSQALGSRR